MKIAHEDIREEINSVGIELTREALREIADDANDPRRLYTMEQLVQFCLDNEVAMEWILA